VRTCPQKKKISWIELMPGRKGMQMISNKTVLQVFIGTILVAIGISSALAEYEPNDNYSSLVLSYRSTTFANPVCVGNDCHTGLSGPAAVYSQQIMPNLALGLSGSFCPARTCSLAAILPH
jgi:hypothetical protein